jgi:hypothetical protein
MLHACIGQRSSLLAVLVPIFLVLQIASFGLLVVINNRSTFIRFNARMLFGTTNTSFYSLSIFHSALDEKTGIEC